MPGSAGTRGRHPPHDAARGRDPSHHLPYGTGLFDLNRVAFAAWTLAAFSIGVLAGMLIRRVVPAILATLAGYAGLAFATGVLLREHYLTPLLSTSLSVSHSAWILGQWWTRGGVTLSQSAMVTMLALSALLIAATVWLVRRRAA